MEKKDTPQEVKLKYLKRFKKRIKRGDGTVPTLAQFAKLSKKDEPVYFKGIKRQSPESRLKDAGIDWNKDKPSARLLRKK